MKLPSMKYGDGIKKTEQVKFGGLNRSEGAQDGEIRDMENMTGDHYPVLATRRKRWISQTLGEPGGLFCWEGLCWMDGEKFFYKGAEKGTLSKGKKVFSSLGPYIVILPDKCFYNVDTDTFGQMEARWTGERLTFTNGVLYEEEAQANTISCQGVSWADWFHVGDAVTIRGCTRHPENNKSIIIRAMDGDKLYFYEFSFTLEEGAEYEETGELAIERTVPELKAVCENENRLWGCSDTTIYASKPGDIFNWNVYDGLESDSWAVEPGSAGFFTGCVSYRGYPIFFKESEICKVYGSVPSNFEVMSSASLGLAEGSGQSLAVAGETLFYLSRSGLMAYTGGIPQPVGRAFGRERMRNAVAGSDGLKYYVSMVGEDGKHGLYVFDTQLGQWFREDESEITHFAFWDGNLYGLSAKGHILILGSAGEMPEGCREEVRLEWFVEFADFTDGSADKKGVGKLQLRLALEQQAELRISIMYDSDGVWRLLRDIVGEDPKRSYLVPVIPRRCDHYRIRLEGTGECRIYSMARERYAGSELKSNRGGY